MNKQLIKKINQDIKKHYSHIVSPITEDMKIEFTDISRIVFFDRYAYCDLELKTLSEGDLVLVTTVEHPTFPERGIGYVSKIHDNETVSVQLEERFVKPEFEGGIVTLPKNRIEKPLELFFEQTAQRVGGVNGIASTEAAEIREAIAQTFIDVIKFKKLVPAGRILNSAGTYSQATYFNCYVMPFMQDSRLGISEHRTNVLEIMSRGGGVGTNGSTLRPRNVLAKGVSGKSSGAVSWLNDLASLTHLVSQGGQRKGAQMLLLNDWHVDIVEFVISKMEKPYILKQIADTTKDPSIREAAKNKLSFKTLSPMERAMYTSIVESNDSTITKEMKAEANRYLIDNGIYTVHNPNFLTGANISVGITKEFMEAVENNEEYPLRFPDIEAYTEEEMKFYNENWHLIGDVREWEKMGYAVKTHRTIKAKDLWDLITICATYSAEPGIFFLDNANEATNAQAYGQKVVSTNPCGEQPLSPWAICNLSSINLAEFGDFKGNFYKEELIKTVKVAIRFQDNIIDQSPYFFEENKIQALGERRVGLGVMGLADLLIKLGVRYGSKEGIAKTSEIFETIKLAAYEESIELAKEKGSFLFLVGKTEEETMELRHKFINTGFMKKMPEYIHQNILKFGIRNSHLLTVAPTGSTGTLIGGATGLEPYFSLKYFRSGRLGQSIEVTANIVNEYYEHYPERINDPLPDYFITAMELSPEEHVDMQCAIQAHVDSALSKTVNAPKGFTVKDVQKIYMRLYKGGAKGGTVYVDGSRSSQVLSLEKDSQFDDGVVEELALDEKTDVDAVQNNEEAKFGNEIGDTCYVCREGELIDAGGCVTCNRCGSQVRCGL
ncbi:ribonucleotide-diphosphate reductase subunit alpha [Lysinibacillus sphaericus]|uniref:vitamin B12-dependent ribonucleotide reductase n=1 Tax=Lysinibacillus sphaericus TaxID=1421 RepID=UPI0018CD2634|nr:vitamin B12-dependent ribonucleotide reductase [Lysinibacillus sphaericus]MBG9693086.1 ribonucleotide-diphosphate reductase subunit alpha [Lysinibacillus sphaericus]